VKQLSVLVADDHAPTRRDVRAALEDHPEIRVCAEASDAAAAIEAAVRLLPDICLLDIRMPGGGIAAAWEITARLPETRVVMFTVSREDDDLFDALRAGAVGYLLKDTDPARLPLAMLDVVRGDAAIPRSLVARLANEFRDWGPRRRALLGHDLDGHLTSREWEVLELLRRDPQEAQGSRPEGRDQALRRHSLKRRFSFPQTTDAERIQRALPLPRHQRRSRIGREGLRTVPATLTRTRVLIADDHPLIRLAVRCELEDAGFEVCGEAADSDGAVTDALAATPDLCLIDVQMPGGGVEAVRRIKGSLPETKVLMLTSSEDEADLVEAMLAGASGFLGKESEPARLPHVLRAVMRGEVAVPRAFISVLVQRMGAASGARAGAAVPKTR
jgi:DNA-binding NarL/FixJ family response regulator